MAQPNIAQPPAFEFDQPHKFEAWFTRFERYLNVSRIANESDVMKRDTLMYCMGEKAEDILRTFALTAEQKKKYKDVSDGFTEYFANRCNIVFERAKFNSRVQGQNESVEDFINSLYMMAQHLQYGELRDELIRDRIIIGIKDKKLSEKLQMQSKLDLSSTVLQCRQSSLVKQQQLSLHAPAHTDDGSPGIQVMQCSQTSLPSSSQRDENAVHSVGNDVQYPGYEVFAMNRQRSYGGGGRGKYFQCGRCGKHHKSMNFCEALKPGDDNKCWKCDKPGHYAKYCRSKRNNNHSSTSRGRGNNPNGYLSNNGWYVKVKVNNALIDFKVDTGSCATILSAEKAKLNNFVIEPCSQKFSIADGSTVNATGQMSCSLTFNNQTISSNVIIFDEVECPLLGLPDILALNLLSTNSITAVNKPTIEECYPTLFQPLGKLREKYKITLQNDAEPYALSQPRPIPIALLDKVENELNRMQELAVISPVTEPTDFCAPMVIVPKPNSDEIRICSDYTHINRWVRRENYPLPDVDYLLAKIGKARVFFIFGFKFRLVANGIR